MVLQKRFVKMVFYESFSTSKVKGYFELRNFSQLNFFL
jgi:hypothetical protein